MYKVIPNNKYQDIKIDDKMIDYNVENFLTTEKLSPRLRRTSGISYKAKNTLLTPLPFRVHRLTGKILNDEDNMPERNESDKIDIFVTVELNIDSGPYIRSLTMEDESLGLEKPFLGKKIFVASLKKAVKLIHES